MFEEAPKLLDASTKLEDVVAFEKHADKVADFWGEIVKMIEDHSSPQENP